MIDSLLKEKDQYPPSENFRRHAIVHDDGLTAFGAKDPDGLWAERVKELTWVKPWDAVLDGNPPFAKWFAQRVSEEPSAHIV